MRAERAMTDDRDLFAALRNEEAEQALLGGILMNNSAFDRCEGLLPAHFSNGIHARIFAAIQKFIGEGRVADAVTLRSYFEHEPGLEGVGAGGYLARLAANAVTIVNTFDYAMTIRDLAVRRNLVTVSQEIAEAAARPAADLTATDLLAEAEGLLTGISDEMMPQEGMLTAGAAVGMALKVAEAVYKDNGRITGLATGFYDIDRILGGLQPSHMVVIAGRPAMGKAQPLDARVKTAAGWKAMGELKFGDELASVDGAPSRVTGLFPQGRKTIYRVTFSDGRAAESCAEHLWRVHYRSWERPRVLSTAQIAAMLERKRYRGRLWVDHCSGHFGHAEPLPVDAWVLGALLGAGNLRGGSARFSTASLDMLIDVQVRLGAACVLKAAGGYNWRVVQRADHRRPGRCGVWPNPLKESLVALGLWDVPGEAKFVPEIYKTANRQERLGVLRGLLDTDGWVERWGSIRFSSASERLARDVVDLVRSLGGWASISSKETRYTYRGEKKAGRRSWVVNIYHPQPKELFSVPAKIARASAAPRRRKMPVISGISVSREAEAQCIAVSHPDRLYITDDYVVTHNTALATSIALNVAMQEEERARDAGEDPGLVAFFSHEMTADQIGQRLISMLSGVSFEQVRSGNIKPMEMGLMVDAGRALERLPLVIDDKPASVPTMRLRLRRLARRRRLKLGIVDYLQLIRPAGRHDSREQEVAEISKGIKAMGMEFGIPMIAVCQLSRAPDLRDDPRPRLADLRESGSIEQDADQVFFVFREEYYVEKREPKQGDRQKDAEFAAQKAQWEQKLEAVRGLAEVDLAKNRHGRTRTFRLRFDGVRTQFQNLARD